MAIKRKTMIWAGAGALAAALLILPRVLGGSDEADARGGRPGSGRGGGRGGDTLVATAAVVRQEPMEDHLATTGQLLSEEEVEVRSEVAGRVVSLPFREGGFVRRGQLLAAIDTDVLEAQLRALRTRHELATVQARRQRQLFEIGGLSRQAVDQAEAEAHVLEAEMQGVRAEVQRRRIYAPFGGQVGLRNVSVGAYVSPGDPIATLRAASSLKLQFSVPERYLGRVRPGDDVVFEVPGQPRAFRATVYAIEQAVDAETRAFTVRARTPNPDGLLGPGAYAEVELVLDRVEDALVVPAGAVVPGADSSAVFVIERGIASRRPVAIGIRQSDRVQVIGGVAAGDTVLTSGVDQVRPGQPVRIARAMGY